MHSVCILCLEVIAQGFSVKQGKCLHKNSFIYITQRFALIFRYSSKPCVQRIIQCNGILGRTMIFHECLIIQLVRLQDRLIQICKKCKHLTFLYTGSKDLLFQRKDCFIRIFLLRKNFQKCQITDPVTRPFFLLSAFQVLADTWCLRLVFYKHSVSLHGEVSSYHTFFSGMADIRFQDLLSFFPVI